VDHQNKILDEIKVLSHYRQIKPGSVSDGLAGPVLNFVTAKLSTTSQEDTKLQLQRDIRAAIEHDESDPSSFIPEIERSRLLSLQRRVLGSLHYAGMEDREERIVDAFGSTFQWIFKDSPNDQRKWDNFKNWLGSDSQLYWITGKAGSGKSTLIKYICEREAVSNHFSAEKQSRCIQYLLP
jgi:hypothetical protein